LFAGAQADNAEVLEVGDEILEVNGQTLENATHNEVIQHIHRVIRYIDDIKLISIFSNMLFV